MNRNLGMSAGVLALLALVLHLSPLGTEQTAGGGAKQTEKTGAESTRENRASAPEKPEFEGPWVATRVLFGAEPLEQDTRCFTNDTPPAEAHCAERDAKFFGVQDATPIDQILATVPTPWHTHLALVSDGGLDAIESAASAAGWVFATEWLPWDDPVDTTEKDPDKRRSERRMSQTQEEEPGVLVFRQEVTSEPHRFTTRILLVFVVGETPTAGISTAQFIRARRYMASLCAGDKSRAPSSCAQSNLIMGPTFSGSFHSLFDVLRKEPEKRFHIRSGVASSVEAAEALWASGNVTSFHGANLSSADFAKYFSEALGALRIPRDKAAVLLEDETTFGASVQASSSGILKLMFPRDISQLRNAYRDGPATGAPQTVAPEVEFSLKDTQTGEDSIPSYSGAQGPLMQDARLEEAVDTIRRQGIQAVEIIASNPLDVLFLARVLQTKSPDTRLILPYTSLMFVEAARTDVLRNILALASYPLMRERVWLRGANPNPVLSHPDSISEGIYNATVLLLAKGNMILPPHRLAQILDDYGWKTQNHPAVWLLTLDREGFIPLRAWLHDRVAEGKESWWEHPVDFAGTSRFDPPGVNARWEILEGLTSLIGVGVILVGLLLVIETKWKDARFLPRVIWYGDRWVKDRWRLFHLMNVLLLLACVQVVLCLPWMFSAHTWVAADSGLLLAIVLLLAAIGPAASWVVYAARAPAAVHTKTVALLTGAGYAAGVLGWWAACADSSQSAGELFALRAVEMRIGSSPTIPILAALFALVLFGYLHMRRLYLATCQEPAIAELESALQGRLSQSKRRLSAHFGAVYGLIDPGEWIAVVGALAAILLLVFPFPFYVSLKAPDARAFNALLIGLEMLLAGALLQAAMLMVRTWADLRSLLTTLGAMPLAKWFVPRSKARNRRPLWVQSLNLQSLSVTAREPTILHDISLKEPALLKDGGIDLYQEYRQAYIKLLDEPQDDNQKPTREQIWKQNDLLRNLNCKIAEKLYRGRVLDHLKGAPLVGRLELTDAKVAAAEPGSTTLVAIPGDPNKVEDLAQAFLALHFTPFLLYSVRQIQNLVWFLSLGFVALSIAMNADSPQSPRLVSRFLLLLLLVIGGVLWRCLSGIERDPILSRIEGTKPEELNAEFYFKLIGYGALPVLGLLASEFPSIANFLFSWIEPTLAALR
ncbi:MAG TPA: hypothetical protein VMG40_11655 [Bryobacteraceae bacterium]|nr:hypothetical protein [Bryobacteraceae bacterium]